MRNLGVVGFRGLELQVVVWAGSKELRFIRIWMMVIKTVQREYIGRENKLSTEL